MKFTSIIAAAAVAAAASGFTEARTCWCTQTGFHLNVSQRACSEGSALGWRWDGLKQHCWNIDVKDTTRYGRHCKNKGAGSYACK